MKKIKMHPSTMEISIIYDEKFESNGKTLFFTHLHGVQNIHYDFDEDDVLRIQYNWLSGELK